MRNYLVVALLFTIGVISCRKDKDMKKATVVNTGNIAANGCGYILRFEDGNFLKPQYLPSAYQHDGYKVKVKFHSESQGVICKGDTDTTNRYIELIYIDDIKRDLD